MRGKNRMDTYGGTILLVASLGVICLALTSDSVIAGRLYVAAVIGFVAGLLCFTCDE